MQTPNERLILARRKAGYEDAASAARAMGVSEPTYHAHENGTRGFVRALDRYAAFFRVSAEWLRTGDGDLCAAVPAETSVPLLGVVAAGARVEWASDVEAYALPACVMMPCGPHVGALQVRGDSMYPRFFDGEYVLYDREPVTPRELVDKYAIVQTIDGRLMIKILREGRKAGTWRVESHNAPAEDNLELLAAWRYLGTLPSL